MTCINASYFSDSELEKRISLSSYDSDGKDLDELKMSKRRKYLLFAISGSLILTVLLTLGLTSIFVLTGKRDINSNSTNITKPRISDDIDTDFSLASGKNDTRVINTNS